MYHSCQHVACGHDVDVGFSSCCFCPHKFSHSSMSPPSRPLNKPPAITPRSKMDEFQAEEGAILGSLLLEPLVMGAGGMVFVDPLFQRVLVQVKKGEEQNGRDQPRCPYTVATHVMFFGKDGNRRHNNATFLTMASANYLLRRVAAKHHADCTIRLFFGKEMAKDQILALASDHQRRA